MGKRNYAFFHQRARRMGKCNKWKYLENVIFVSRPHHHQRCHHLPISSKARLFVLFPRFLYFCVGKWLSAADRENKKLVLLSTLSGIHLFCFCYKSRGNILKESIYFLFPHVSSPKQTFQKKAEATTAAAFSHFLSHSFSPSIFWSADQANCHSHAWKKSLLHTTHRFPNERESLLYFFFTHEAPLLYGKSTGGGGKLS